MKVGLLGDVHGAQAWTEHAIEALANAGAEIIVQAGDFGIWGGRKGEYFLDRVAEKLEEVKLSMYVVPGNHENYDMIIDPAETSLENLKLQYLRKRLWVLPRGKLLRIGDMTFMGFGGAASIDRGLREGQGIDWWAEEMFRESDFDRLADVAEGMVDVLVSHEATSNGTQKVQEILNTPEHMRYGQWDYDYAARSTAFMDRVFEKVKPKIHVHGHMHVSDYRKDEVEGVEYVSLSMNGDAGNAAILDTATGGIDFRVII